MAWSDTYPRIVAELARKNGQWSPGVPKMQSSDAVGTLASYVASLRIAIENSCHGIAPSVVVGADGIIDLGGNLGNIALANARISVAGYISNCTPVGGNAWKRFAPDQPNIASWEPFRAPSLTSDDPLTEFFTGLLGAGSRNEQPEQVQLARAAMDTYQATIEVVNVNALLYRGVTWGEASCSTFLRKLRLLGGNLDQMHSNPPTTLTDDIKGALNDAKNASEQATKDVAHGLGKAAGDVANLSGGVLSEFLNGLFGSVGTVGLAVIVAYVAYKVYL